MRYIKENDALSIFNELKKYENFYVSDLNLFIKTLEYGGSVAPEYLGPKEKVGYIPVEIDKRLNPDKDKEKKPTYEELEEMVRIQQDYIDGLKKHSKETKQLTFKFIDENTKKYNLSIKKLCKTLGVSYEGLRKGKLLGRRTESKYDEKLLSVVEESFRENKGNFGRPKLLYYLNNIKGVAISDNTLFRYMTKLGLKCEAKNGKGRKAPKEYKEKGKFDNLIKKDFKTTKPNTKGFIDESYIEMPRGRFAYLCAIIDSYNNEIVGYKVSDYRDKYIAFDAIEMATKNRDASNLVLHSDRSVIYNSFEFMDYCKEKNITQSMNDAPDSTQNRPIEYFFSIFKTEYLRFLEINDRSLSKLESFVKESILDYNNIRFQQCLSWNTPLNYK